MQEETVQPEPPFRAQYRHFFGTNSLVREGSIRVDQISVLTRFCFDRAAAAKKPYCGATDASLILRTA
jgi:hypothetical protein